jgi:O-antigen/teichoic acid export membrane protein
MSEVADFRNALMAAGEPWSRWGVRAAGAGIAALLALQLIPRVPYALYALIAAIGVIAVGWVMLIAAVFKRRRWAKDHPIADVGLDRQTLTEAP